MSSTRNREQGAAHEKSMTERHRMDGTRGSGCGKKEKGDTKDDTWMGEGKSSRGKKGITVDEDMLDKAWRDGKHMGKIPFIDLDFTREKKTRRPRHWTLVPGPVFQILKDRLTDEEKELLRP
jgi:hypothetical protein